MVMYPDSNDIRSELEFPVIYQRLEILTDLKWRAATIKAPYKSDDWTFQRFELIA